MDIYSRVAVNLAALQHPYTTKTSMNSTVQLQEVHTAVRVSTCQVSKALGLGIRSTTKPLGSTYTWCYQISSMQHQKTLIVADGH